MTVESLYQTYLKEENRNENDMTPQENNETKRAYYAGFTDFFHIVMKDCEKFNDNEYQEILKGFSSEILTFWLNAKISDKGSTIPN